MPLHAGNFTIIMNYLNTQLEITMGISTTTMTPTIMKTPQDTWPVDEARIIITHQPSQTLGNYQAPSFSISTSTPAPSRAYGFYDGCYPAHKVQNEIPTSMVPIAI